MASTLKAILRVESSGLSTTSATHEISAEAYERIEVTVPAAAGGADGTLTVDVQPGGAGQVRLVCITASAYPTAADGSAELTYSVDGGDAVDLDAPLLLVGGGIRTLLGNVQQVVFTNASAAEVDVVIVVGRDATPP